ncbi:MAG TPA: hypothetical protein VLL76_04410 [Candidatus Omnitrophota bacterium]|nr:hypothetical protein [Candidatus Omnitrophota bacterium]
MESQAEEPEVIPVLDNAPEPGRRCRNMVGVAIKAFVDLMQDSASDGKVSMDQARRIANAIMAASGPLADYYARTEGQCDAIAQLGMAERKRTDFFGRLITQPFAHLLDDAETGIDRKRLPQFFAAIRMVLGDETHAALKARCVVLAEEHRMAQGLIDWEAFYADPDADQVLEQVLFTMARSFKRFEPRKDWFMIVMNSNPTSVSLGQNVFTPKAAEDRVVAEFTLAHMVTLFEALFAGFRPEAMSKARRNTFIARWGSDPDKVMGPLFIELAALKRRA